MKRVNMDNSSGKKRPRPKSGSEQTPLGKKEENGVVRLQDIICSENIDLSMEAFDKEQVLDKMCGILCRNGYVSSRREFLQAVQQREAKGFTSLGGGVAIPHGVSQVVLRTGVAIARLKKPVEWEAGEDEPVDFILLFAVNSVDKPDGYIRLVSQAARAVADPAFSRSLGSIHTQQELLRYFDKYKEDEL